MENKHTVYILRCKDRTLYTGYTNNLERRLKMHQEGKGAKYTRGRGPFQVVYVEYFETKEQAMKKEYTIKQLTREEKWRFIRDRLKEVMINE
ncbi:MULTISPECIES: GIY-YIG nuclease family protein [Clostridia]|uniref:GIY-YIG nuclease family protein n=1 Tax=Clostridia TaxID=186801 RepID=UPI000EA2B681|nr:MULTISPECIES: GIY-YIG nuclease family protein [Clostridia]NBJ70866.1 GIY-YIG nuclease family protein [Roseburia sp. 1XD42-34]RKI75653.1 GIY-YIG nuclease family protein [Clostridium sp. 1xD42-85]